MRDYPNGFNSWQKTHFEVVQFITIQEEGWTKPVTIIDRVRKDDGLTGLYDMAKKWTDEFENEYRGKEWDGDYLDTLDSFLIAKNNFTTQ
jgi:hypothetical protein